MYKTQADRLAELYSDIHDGKPLPADIEQEALNEEISDLQQDQLPQLHVVVSGKKDVIADLVATMPACIMAANKIYYFELACTSSATAHAFAGALSENRVNAKWQVKWPGVTKEFIDVEMADSMNIQDCRLVVKGWHKQLHHVAALSSSGELFIADSDEVLWQKLRNRMSCPALPDWGKALMPRVHRAGLFIETKTEGIKENVKTYILSPDASDLFDNIISEHVRKIGGL